MLRRGTLWILTLIAVLCPAGTALALPEATEIKSPVAKASFKAAQQFLNKNQARRASYLPKGFKLPKVGDEVVIQYKRSDGDLEETRLNTVKSAMIDLGRSLRAMSDRGNLVRAYKLVYGKLPKKFRKDLSTPKQVNGQALKKVQKSYQSLMLKFRKNFDDILIARRPAIPGLLSINPIGVCSAEIGYEVAGSESEVSDRCEVSEYEAGGLFGNVDFPLKRDLTCIKDQGRRGTCAAQAIAATTETLELVSGGSAENLSEQHIYYRGETEGDSQISLGDMQIYGLATTVTLDAFDAGNFGIFYESGWNYNRSLGMGAVTVIPAQQVLNYPDSCDANYTGESCSDFTWQTGATLFLPGLPNPAAPPVIPPPAPHQILTNTYLPCDALGGLVTQSTLQMAILLLASDVPIIISMQVTDAFRNTTDGFVLNSANDPVVGGHAMELVGYVPARDIPGLAPLPTEEGYFIVKNSWGTNAGDCGFYYLDYGYVRDHVSYLSVIAVS